jgi:ligand-binding SRPBCC domain-containing protein
MPNITLNTKVQGSVEEVFARFDQELFQYLKPPTFIADIVLYEGSAIGNRVSVAFKLPWRSLMEVEITEIHLEPSHSYFVDQGIQMPFGIKSWRHAHHVIASGPCVVIRDQITFESKYRLANLFIWPAFYISFYLRKPQYKKYFGVCQ